MNPQGDHFSSASGGPSKAFDFLHTILSLKQSIVGSLATWDMIQILFEPTVCFSQFHNEAVSVRKHREYQWSKELYMVTIETERERTKKKVRDCDELACYLTSACKWASWIRSVEHSPSLSWLLFSFTARLTDVTCFIMCPGCHTRMSQLLCC